MKLSILFVDSDEESSKKIKEAIFPFKKNWTVFHAANFGQAMAIIDENDIDIVVSELILSDATGAVLLTKIKEHFPHIIRIIMSESRDKLMNIHVANVAHQFLLLPMEGFEIKTKIEKTFALRNHIENEDLRKYINSLNGLPSMPEIYMKLEEESQKSDASLKKISEIISQDIAMTAKILQLVNSSFFGIPSKVTSLAQAVNFLGIRIIKSLVLYIKLFSSFQIQPDLKYIAQNIWKHSLKVGIATKNIILNESMFVNLVDDAFIAGILHDIGKLVLLSDKETYSSILEHAHHNNFSDVASEYELLKTSHAEIGAYLLGLWGLPESIVEATAFHHFPSKTGDMNISLTSALHLANSFVSIPDIDKEFFQRTNLDSRLKEIILACQQ